MPPWTLGHSRYARLGDGRFVFAYTAGGFDRLAVRLRDGTVRDLDVPCSRVSCVRAAAEASVAVVAGTPVSEEAVTLIELAQDTVTSRKALRPARDLAELGIGADTISVPEAIAFPSTGGRTSHGLFYPPVNPDWVGERGKLPPLLVQVHGGPTRAASPVLALSTQYWTSRGFSVVAVNYTGSTGYGRGYRDRLRGAWGIVDVDDCFAAANFLVERGTVDPARLCIRGGSAGGFTTLAALARDDTPFAAGADHFGIADLEALARETHKFESHYLDGLVAPYPDGAIAIRERSPITRIDQFSRPLIVFQGLEDEVVPSNQAEMIVDALRVKRVPVAYLPFAGEQHGFRRAVNIRRALDAELSFYAQIFGFGLPAAEEIEAVGIEGLAPAVGRATGIDAPAGSARRG